MKISPIVINNVYNYKRKIPVFKSRTDTFERTPNNSYISNETYSKAKNMVIATIKDKNPKESLVLVQDDKIIAFTTGDSDKVSGDEKIRELLFDPYNKIHVIHSHPQETNGKTLPVSFGDYKCLVDQMGVIATHAIDIDGHHSILSKTPDFKFTIIDECENIYRKNYSNALISRPDLKARYETLLNEYENFLVFTDEDMEHVNLLIIELNYLIDIAASLDETPKVIHDFWLKYADKMGLKYSTNFIF